MGILWAHTGAIRCIGCIVLNSDHYRQVSMYCDDISFLLSRLHTKSTRPKKVKSKVVRKKTTKWTKGEDAGKKGKAATKKRGKADGSDEEWVIDEEEEGEGEEEEGVEELEVEEGAREVHVRSPMKEYGAHQISMSASGECAEDGEPFFAKFDPDSYKDSREASRELLKMMISPVQIDQFLRLAQAVLLSRLTGS